MTRLPLALEPLPDESWPSYLTRRAAQHGTTLAGLGSHLGLRDERGRWPGRFGVSVSPGHVERVAMPERKRYRTTAALLAIAGMMGGIVGLPPERRR